MVGIREKYSKLDDENLPLVSIIVAARNEEVNIRDCLVSLNGLIYPEDKIEIIIVDDHSTDKTGDIIRDYIKDKLKFRTLSPNKKIGALKGKANAIANALETASGEIILTTDADCMVSVTWAKTLASYYKGDVAIVCGYTNQEEYNSFAGMQSVDFIYLLAVAAGSMNLGKPLSCIGNNMSYRKSVYEEIGGYEAIPFSVTEDFKLLMTVHNLKKYKIIYPLDSGGLVKSKPCHDLKSLYWQKKRWGVGGLDSDLVGFSIMAVGALTHLAVMLTPFFYSIVSLYLILFKILIDFYFLLPVYKKLGLKLQIKHFLAFEIYFIIYVIGLPLLVFFNRKIKWKGREF